MPDSPSLCSARADLRRHQLALSALAASVGLSFIATASPEGFQAQWAAVVAGSQFVVATLAGAALVRARRSRQLAHARSCGRLRAVRATLAMVRRRAADGQAEIMNLTEARDAANRLTEAATLALASDPPSPSPPSSSPPSSSKKRLPVRTAPSAPAMYPPTSRPASRRRRPARRPACTGTHS